MRDGPILHDPSFNNPQIQNRYSDKRFKLKTLKEVITQADTGKDRKLFYGDMLQRRICNRKTEYQQTHSKQKEERL
jgi:hypothetical protein